MIKHIGDKNPQLIIDPGHGGSDPGASGNGITEKQMVLDISMYQYKRFEELGAAVALTRDSDTSLDPSTRAALIKSIGAKHCISNHINAAASPAAQGAEIIHSVHSNGLWAKQIASRLQAAGQQLCPTATYSKRQSNGQDYYYMHRLTGNVSTVIVEYGFCSNETDAQRLKNQWLSYSEAAVFAYCNFIGHR